MVLTVPVFRTWRRLLFVAFGAVFATCTGCTLTTGSFTVDPDASAARRLAAADFNPNRIERMAILVRNETGTYIPPGVLRRIDDEVTYTIIHKGHGLAARADIDAVLQEQTLQRLGFTESRAAQLGRMLNAQAVLVVSITANSVKSFQAQIRRSKKQPALHEAVYCGEASISARLVGAEGANVLWLASHTGEARFWKPEQAADLLPVVAAEVARAFPTRPPREATSRPTP